MSAEKGELVKYERRNAILSRAYKSPTVYFLFPGLFCVKKHGGHSWPTQYEIDFSQQCLPCHYKLCIKTGYICGIFIHSPFTQL